MFQGFEPPVSAASLTLSLCCCLCVCSGAQHCTCATREPWLQPTPWCSRPVSTRVTPCVFSLLQEARVRNAAETRGGFPRLCSTAPSCSHG